jgi:hypothetical protein
MKTLLLTLSLIIVSSTIIAQYDVVTFTSQYNELSGATTLALEEGWDDPEVLIPFGFDFTIGNLTVNNMVQIGLGSEFVLGNLNNGGYIGYFVDVADAAGIDGEEPSKISYLTEGEPGNRICKVQYLDCAFYAEVFGQEMPPTSVNNRLNFQIWIYETDNAIEFRFGSNTIVDPDLVYEGANGPQIAVVTGLNADGEEFNVATVLDGSPEDPTVINSQNVNEVEFVTLNGTPQDGRVYRFSPGTVNTSDQQLESFTVYPTMAQNEIWIKDYSGMRSAFTMYDQAGKQVRSGIYANGEALNISSLTPGMYFITLDNNVSTIKFVKY